ncbi:MAG: THUMP-like domain-containing protein [Planctomycetota bacterium]
MSPDDVQHLTQPAIRAALAAAIANGNDDPAAFTLRHSGRSDYPVAAMAEQLRCQRKAASKLPAWAAAGCLFTHRALEQCSAPGCAHFATSLINGYILDLTAGLGVDASAHASAGHRVIACERDPTLTALLHHNAKALGLAIDIRDDDGLSVAANLTPGTVDWIYADPDRRVGGTRSLDPKHWSPDLFNAREQLIHLCPRWLIKVASATDTTAIDRYLPHRQELFVIGHHGECKQILVRCDASRPAPGRPVHHAVIVNDDGSVSAHLSSADHNADPAPGPLGAWIAEPHPCVIRAGLAGLAANQAGLHPLAPDLAWLSGDDIPATFPGRRWQVIDQGRYQTKALRRRLRELGVSKLTIARRHFPHDPATIAKQLKVTPSGGGHHLLCYRDGKGQTRYALGLRGDD